MAYLDKDSSRVHWIYCCLFYLLGGCWSGYSRAGEYVGQGGYWSGYSTAGEYVGQSDEQHGEDDHAHDNNVVTDACTDIQPAPVVTYKEEEMLKENNPDI